MVMKFASFLLISFFSAVRNRMEVNRINKCKLYLQFEKYTFQEVIWPRLVQQSIKVVFTMGEKVSKIKFT